MLWKKVSRMEEKIYNAKAYERKDTPIFFRKAVHQVTQWDIYPQLACGLLKEHLKLVLNACDISTTHRIGKRPTNQQPDIRNITIKLCRRNLKSDILDACRQVKQPNLYINESLLNPSRSPIMYVLRSARKRFRDKKYLVVGRGMVRCACVFVKPLNPNSSGTRNGKVSVNTHLKLQMVCNEIQNTPLSTFFNKWPDN